MNNAAPHAHGLRRELPGRRAREFLILQLFLTALFGLSRLPSSCSSPGETSDADALLLSGSFQAIGAPGGVTRIVPFQPTATPQNALRPFPLAASRLFGLPAAPNCLSAADFAQVRGIGAKMAEWIVRERDLNGPFETFESFQRVRGLGPAKVDLLKQGLGEDADFESCVDEIGGHPPGGSPQNVTQRHYPRQLRGDSRADAAAVNAFCSEGQQAVACIIHPFRGILGNAELPLRPPL